MARQNVHEQRKREWRIRRKYAFADGEKERKRRGKRKVQMSENVEGKRKRHGIFRFLRLYRSFLGDFNKKIDIFIRGVPEIIVKDKKIC